MSVDWNVYANMFLNVILPPLIPLIVGAIVGSVWYKAATAAVAKVPPDVWAVIAFAEKWRDSKTTNSQLETYATDKYLNIHPGADVEDVRRWIQVACAFRKVAVK